MKHTVIKIKMPSFRNQLIELALIEYISIYLLHPAAAHQPLTNPYSDCIRMWARCNWDVKMQWVWLEFWVFIVSVLVLLLTYRGNWLVDEADEAGYYILYSVNYFEVESGKL